MPIYEASERVLRAFQDEFMPAESFSEFLDVVGQTFCMHFPAMYWTQSSVESNTNKKVLSYRILIFCTDSFPRSSVRHPRPWRLPAGPVELCALMAHIYAPHLWTRDRSVQCRCSLNTESVCYPDTAIRNSIRTPFNQGPGSQNFYQLAYTFIHLHFCSWFFRVGSFCYNSLLNKKVTCSLTS